MRGRVDTIAAAAGRLRRGETTALALIQSALTAVAEHNARTNAFIAVTADAALSAAAAVDRERAHGVDRGPLHGIPISLKDLIDQAGVVTTAGSTVLDDRTASSDAAVVARLHEAGAIIIGRTNLHQFAVGTTSEDSSFGAVRHPQAPDRSPGGSSGGSAAAVATGMGLASIGTDTGGSIRIPAAVCGIVGLKATTGEIPNDGVIPMSLSLDHVGPLTRTVQDAAWVADVLAGRAPETIAPIPIRGLRLARLDGYFDVLAPDVRLAFEAALERLSLAGARVGLETLPNTDRISSVYANIALPEAAAWHAPFLDSRTPQYAPAVHARISHGRTVSAVDYLAARDAAAAYRADVDALLAGHEAIVLPTLPIVAPPIGLAEVVIDPSIGVSMPTRLAMLKHTQLFNLTGHPAISLPLPVRADGLPVGLQLVGRRHETARLLALAAACEAVLRDSAPGR